MELELPLFLKLCLNVVTSERLMNAIKGGIEWATA